MGINSGMTEINRTSLNFWGVPDGEDSYFSFVDYIMI